MDSKALELSELLDRANALRENDADLSDTDPFNERTVYYYVQQGLLPRTSRRRGPGTTYPAEFVDRLLFIRRLQKKQSLTLANIRSVMDQVPEETIRRVGRGDEPLEIRVLGADAPDFSSLEEDVVELQSMNLGDVLAVPEDRATDVASTLMHSRSGQRREEPPAMHSKLPEFDFESDTALTDEARRFEIGRNAELVVNKALTPLQEKRLEQVALLVKSILED